MPAPLLHPTIVYLKCHEGEGVHAHALVHHPMLANRLLRALHRPCCQTSVTCVGATVCWFVCMCMNKTFCVSHERERTRAHVTPFSNAVPISGGTASRCIREYTRPWISNLLSLSLSLSLSLHFPSILFLKLTY